MEFYLHKFKLLEILSLISIKLQISISWFWPLASLQIIKDTSGGASFLLLSYKLTPAKIKMLHMCLLHFFPNGPRLQNIPHLLIIPK